MICSWRKNGDYFILLTRAKDKLTEKGNESGFLKEIPDIFTVKTSIPIKSVAEKVITCPSVSVNLKNFLHFALIADRKQPNDQAEQ